MKPMINEKEHHLNEAHLPDNFRKHLVSWMPLQEIKKLNSGWILLQNYVTEHFSLSYLVTDLLEEQNIPEQIYKADISIHYLLQGHVTSCVAGSREIISFREKNYCGMSIPPGNHSLIFYPGMTRLLSITLNTDYIRPLLEHFTSLYQAFFGKPANSALKCPRQVLDHEVERVIKQELLTDIPRPTLLLKIQTAIYNLLARYESALIHAPSRPKSAIKYEEAIEKIMEEIQLHPNRHIQTSKYFSRKYALGEGTLNNYFQLITGETLAAYRQTHCMIHAQEMIRQGLPINEIADQLGYSEATNFSIAYKEHFGHAPSRYLSTLQ